MGASAADASPASSAPGEELRQARIETLAIVEAAHLRELVRDLELRMPGVRVTGDASADADVYVTVDDAGSREVEITLVTEDGRAYTRTVWLAEAATPRETSRLVASTIANLVSGIETGTEVPKRIDAAPDRRVAPAAEPGTTMRSRRRAGESTTSARRRWEIGSRLELGSGASPPSSGESAAFVGGGGALAVHGRAPSGGMPVFALRFFGQRLANGSALLRTRIALGGGYAWRPAKTRNGLELSTAAMFTVEPWWVLRSRGRTAAARRLPLVGAAVMADFGYRHVLGQGYALRIGLWQELALSGLATGGVPMARIRESAGIEPRTLARLGGFEWTGGLSLTLWIAPR